MTQDDLGPGRRVREATGDGRRARYRHASARTSCQLGHEVPGDRRSGDVLRFPRPCWAADPTRHRRGSREAPNCYSRLLARAAPRLGSGFGHGSCGMVVWGIAGTVAFSHPALAEESCRKGREVASATSDPSPAPAQERGCATPAPRSCCRRVRIRPDPDVPGVNAPSRPGAVAPQATEFYGMPGWLSLGRRPAPDWRRGWPRCPAADLLGRHGPVGGQPRGGVGDQVGLGRWVPRTARAPGSGQPVLTARHRGPFLSCRRARVRANGAIYDY